MCRDSLCTHASSSSERWLSGMLVMQKGQGVLLVRVALSGNAPYRKEAGRTNLGAKSMLHFILQRDKRPVLAAGITLMHVARTLRQRVLICVRCQQAGLRQITYLSAELSSRTCGSCSRLLSSSLATNECASMRHCRRVQGRLSGRHMKLRAASRKLEGQSGRF